MQNRRDQLSSERFITFPRTEMTWILRPMVLLPFILPSAKYPIPTPKYHTYLRRAVPTANGACAGEMASPFYIKAIAAVAAAHQHRSRQHISLRYPASFLRVQDALRVL